jgi:hypothetical protein
MGLWEIVGIVNDIKHILSIFIVWDFCFVNWSANILVHNIAAWVANSGGLAMVSPSHMFRFGSCLCSHFVLCLGFLGSFSEKIYIYF